MLKSLLTFILAASATIISMSAGSCNQKNNIMWLDLSGMWTRFTCPDTVDYYMDRIVDCGFNTVVIDVRNTGSSVGYKSDIAPRLLDWKGVRIDPEYDYLDTVLTSAKRHGLTAYAAFNIFVRATLGL